MAILLNNEGFESESWAQAFRALLPSLPVYTYPELPSKSEIEYAVVWNHPHGDLLSYPNLKAVLLLGSGTDHIDKEPNALPAPVVRLIDPAVGDAMAQYALYWVMHFHRGYELYRQRAAQAQWHRHQPPRLKDYRVSVLGLGRIGKYIAEQIARNGFKTQAWSRSPHQADGVDCFSGQDGFTELLAQTDCLINCLPLVDSTKHLLNQASLSQLPKGSAVINVSRGAVIDDDALITLLKSGHISQAALDTFAIEPLPPESPYWAMDNVYVTPHISGATYTDEAASVIADNILRIQNDEAPFPIHELPNSRATALD